MKKSIITACAGILLAFTCLFTGCQQIALKLEDDSQEQPSLKLDYSDLILNDAVCGVTCKVITASKTGISAGVKWYSSDTSVFSVTNTDEMKTTITVLGEGSAVLTAETTDGKYNACCSITTVLSKAGCDPVTELKAANVTQESMDITWKDSETLQSVKVIVLKDDETILSKDLEKGVQKISLTDLRSNESGIEYTVSVYGILDGKTSRPATITQKTAADKSAPADITEFGKEITDSSIVLTWTDPADSDFVCINFSFEGTDYYDKDLKAVTVNKGVQTLTLSSLKAGTDYKVTANSVDHNGLVSRGKTETFTTLADETAPDESSEVFAILYSGILDLEWTEPDNMDFAKIVLMNGETSMLEAEKGTVSERITLDADTDYEFKFCTVDSYGNRSAGKTVTVSTKEEVIPLVSDITTETGLTGQIKVNWTNPAGDETYVYYLGAQHDEEILYNRKPQVSGGTVYGLTPGTEYNIFVAPGKENDGVTVVYVSASNVTAATPVKVLWRMLSGYTNNGQLTRYVAWVKSSTLTTYDVAAMNASDPLYGYWLVYPALSGNEDYFSLMASDESGTETGYYMYLDANDRSMTNTTHTYVWTYGDPAKPILMVATLDGSENAGKSWIQADRKDASFKKEASSWNSSYNVLYDENKDYYICHASMTFGGKARGTTEDKDGCAAVKITETKLP